MNRDFELERLGNGWMDSEVGNESHQKFGDCPTPPKWGSEAPADTPAVGAPHCVTLVQLLGQDDTANGIHAFDQMHDPEQRNDVVEHTPIWENTFELAYANIVST